MSKVIARHIQIDPEHRRRIESLANECRTTPNQLLVKLPVEALDNGEWPRNPLEIQMLRSCPFTAQATARDMIAAGRKEELDRDLPRHLANRAGCAQQGDEIGDAPRGFVGNRERRHDR